MLCQYPSLPPGSSIRDVVAALASVASVALLASLASGPMRPASALEAPSWLRCTMALSFLTQDFLKSAVWRSFRFTAETEFRTGSGCFQLSDPDIFKSQIWSKIVWIRIDSALCYIAQSCDSVLSYIAQSRDLMKFLTLTLRYVAQRGVNSALCSIARSHDSAHSVE
jgi:hypothetical protein